VTATESARVRRYRRRGGGAVKVKPIESQGERTSGRTTSSRSTAHSKRWRDSIRGKSRVIELRFFGGLSVEKTPSVMNVSAATVMRELAKARFLPELGNR
jgi:RNA polymerase sigma-70 factor, ECF subfamily